MQADLFVKSHLLEDETTTIAPDSPTNQEYNNHDDTQIDLHWSGNIN
jgi:hypothetical protein